MSRTAIAVLSTENLLHNVGVLRQRAPHSKIVAMVKANGYGHGIRSVALRLEGHVDGLGVASIDEALALRKVGVKTPIVLMEGVFEAAELLEASTHGLEVVFHSPHQVEWLEKGRLPLPLKAWIKVNTGMGRLGFSLHEAPHFYDRLLGSAQTLGAPVMMTHMACADEVAHPLNATQIKAFEDFSEKREGLRSLCNSAALFHFPHHHYDYVRPGLALYGVSPVAGLVGEDLGLKPVMTLQTSIIAVQDLKAGEGVGYGARFKCPQNMRVGIIAFGYGDGYPLGAQDGTPLLVNNIECPLVGRVSMDMIAVDLTPCPTAQVGDPVILWGEGLPVEKVAAHTGNLGWNMLTSIQNRVKFLWTQSCGS